MIWCTVEIGDVSKEGMSGSSGFGPCLNLNGSLKTIALSVSGFFSLYKYPISVTAFLHPLSAMENIVNALPSSALIAGPVHNLSRWALAIL